MGACGRSPGYGRREHCNWKVAHPLKRYDEDDVFWLGGILSTEIPLLPLQLSIKVGVFAFRSMNTSQLNYQSSMGQRMALYRLHSI